MKRSKKPTPATFATIRELADALKIPRSTTYSWTQRDDWRWEARAPWPAAIIPDVLAWAATLDRGGHNRGSGGPSRELRAEKLRQEIRKLTANADQAQTALAKERYALHDSAACKVEAVRRWDLIRSGTAELVPQGVALALSHGLPAEAAAAFTLQMREAIGGCIRYLNPADSLRPATGTDPD